MVFFSALYYNTFLLLFYVFLKHPSLKIFTRNDKAFSISDRLLLILSFSGGARGVIVHSS